jgi:acetoin utilization deacetylase AcuC-like enzyme
MLIVSSQAHHAHRMIELDNGVLIDSSESPDRADLIERALIAIGHEFIEPERLDLDLVQRVHTADYVEFLSTAWDRWSMRDGAANAAMAFTWPTRGMFATRPTDLMGQLGYHSFSADSSIVAGTWDAACAAAAIAMTAADRMLDDGAATYGLCRPPGHHATADQFGGYCFLNNAAIAAQRLRNRGCAHVAILDVDYHHGNGTQSIFYERNDVLFVSIHADPIEEFPWFVGHAAERGSGAGEGANVNLPLACGSGVEAWFGALDRALDTIAAAEVDALVVSLGVDTFVDDPLGTFQLTTSDFTKMAQRIESTGVAMTIVQEGGYAVEAIGANVAAFLGGITR